MGTGSCGERFAGEGPSEGLGHGFVEVGDKRLDALFEFGGRFESATAQELAGQDGKPDFDLVEPGSVLRSRCGESYRAGTLPFRCELCESRCMRTGIPARPWRPR
jgi:hypothetical protein